MTRGRKRLQLATWPQPPGSCSHWWLQGKAGLSELRGRLIRPQLLACLSLSAPKPLAVRFQLPDPGHRAALRQAPDEVLGRGGDGAPKVHAAYDGEVQAAA
mmetsp:Transcript_33899/g.97468  ORF Transcript_33899/g.97468 Transcript_33899/m.97468 type:complete len:101 (-) Transcript_33899:372-674(-)